MCEKASSSQNLRMPGVSYRESKAQIVALTLSKNRQAGELLCSCCRFVISFLASVNFCQCNLLENFKPITGDKLLISFPFLICCGYCSFILSFKFSSQEILPL